MKYENVLPEDFDGTFRFTNWTDEDFVGTWNKREYNFPAKSTSPIVMHDQTPLEIQQIRKKFAKDLAEREFFKSTKYEGFTKQERNSDGTARLNSIHSAATYTLDDLASFIQRCLEPLPAGEVKVKMREEVPLESKLSRNDDGELNTQPVDKKTSLKKKALEA